MRSEVFYKLERNFVAPDLWLKLFIADKIGVGHKPIVCDWKDCKEGKKGE